DPGTSLPHGPLSVEVSRLSFSYGRGGPVLHDVDVTIPSGANVAVVGETGSGKTTFAKLLCRLADPTGGHIVVGGVDLRDVSSASRHAAVRMVPRDGFLFAASVRENVRMGHDSVTDEQVVDAFASLGLDGWVVRLPAGLATLPHLRVEPSRQVG